MSRDSSISQMKWNPEVEKQLKTFLQRLQRSVNLALPFSSLPFPSLAVETSLAITFCIKYSRCLHPQPKIERGNVGGSTERRRDADPSHLCFVLARESSHSPAGLDPARSKQFHRTRPQPPAPFVLPPGLPSDCPFFRSPRTGPLTSSS